MRRVARGSTSVSRCLAVALGAASLGVALPTDTASASSPPAVSSSFEASSEATPPIMLPAAVEVTPDSATLLAWLSADPRESGEPPGPKREPEESGREGAEDEPPFDQWYFEYAPGATCAGPEARSTPTESVPRTHPTMEVSAKIASLREGTVYAACLVHTVGYSAFTDPAFSFATSATRPTVAPATPSNAAVLSTAPPTLGSPIPSKLPSGVVSARTSNPSRLARALKACSKKPRRQRARCARRARRRYGARHT